MPNIDEKVVEGFGREWSKFDHANVPLGELQKFFDAYFTIFPSDRLPEKAKGFDLGCGTGRWAKFVAPRVGELHCIDPSEDALKVAVKNLSAFENCHFHLAGVDNIPLPDNSMDFGYSLGVLHHVPDTAAAIRSCAAKLKPGAPLLLYLYYRFDNKPVWFKLVWKLTDYFRRFLSKSPFVVKYVASQIIAACVYLPLSRIAKAVEYLGWNVENLPLSIYRDKSYYVMRTDALDRFGTRLEQRFTKDEIKVMMNNAGLDKIHFNKTAPYWCIIGYKQNYQNIC